MKTLFILFCAVLNGLAAVAQRPAGSRAAAMANAAVVNNDRWAIFNNIGGLAWIDEPGWLFSCENRFNMAALNTVAVAHVRPLRPFSGLAGGFSVSRFGDHLYNQTNLSLALSHKINHVSLGLRCNYLQISIEGAGSRGVVAFEFGGVASITKQLFFGAHIYNLNQARLSDFRQERLPTLMKAGLSYRPLQNLTLNLETEKDADYAPVLKMGMEYKPISQLALRTGLAGKLFVNSYGIGVMLNCFEFDYAFSSYSRLLPAHQVSVLYRCRKLKRGKE